MKMVTSKYQSLITKEKELAVNHNGKDLTFSSSYYLGSYSSVGRQIDLGGLIKPTMAETASLIDDQFLILNNLIREVGLLVFTETLYVSNGVYIQDRPDFLRFMDESDLIKRLERNDSSVRFVPFGFKIGEMTCSELAKNPFVIGLSGEEGAQKLAEVSGKYEDGGPYLKSYNSVTDKIRKVSLINYCYDPYKHDLGSRFNIDGSNHGFWGCVFGILKTG